MRKIQLPEKVRKFLVPGVLLLAAFFIAGGLYFRQRSLNFSHQAAVSQEGKVSGIQTNLPQNFPSDIFLFEPSQILSSHESAERIQITFQTDASVERVRELYQQKMGALGWRLTRRGGENGVLTFTKDDRRLQLTIIPDPAGPTLIILNTIS